MDPHLAVGFDGRLELRGGVEREQLPVVHDRDAVAELVRFLHVVRREEDRLPFGVELAHDLPEGDAALRIKTGGRFVEKEDAAARA